MTDAPKQQIGSPAEPSDRDSGPVEGVRGNREVPPATSQAPHPGLPNRPCGRNESTSAISTNVKMIEYDPQQLGPVDGR